MKGQRYPYVLLLGSLLLGLSGPAQADVFPPLNFGPVSVGSSATLPYVLFCPASAGLLCSEITAYQLTGSSDFSVVSQNCTGIMLPGGSTCAFNIQFTPSGVGAESATLVLFDPSASNYPAYVALTGSGGSTAGGGNGNSGSSPGHTGGNPAGGSIPPGHSEVVSLAYAGQFAAPEITGGIDYRVHLWLQVTNNSGVPLTNILVEDFSDQFADIGIPGVDYGGSPPYLTLAPGASQVIEIVGPSFLPVLDPSQCTGPTTGTFVFTVSYETPSGGAQQHDPMRLPTPCVGG
jgi:hypothetical protein